MPTKTTPRDLWKVQQAAQIGLGHFALVQGGDGAWRVALIDQWLIQKNTLEAAFDAVHPDGSLDFCGEVLSIGHWPQDLGRADLFFSARPLQCAQIDEVWAESATLVLAPAHPRWQSWSCLALPTLIRAKAVYRLWDASLGAPSPAAARLALEGAMQENIELCALRGAGLAADVQSALDQMDARAINAKSARRKRVRATDKETV